MSDRPTPETDYEQKIDSGDTWPLFEFARRLERERDEAREIARELRDALEAVDYIDLSPCNGGSCMVATNADDAIDAIKNKAAPLLTKAKEVLP